MDPAQLAEWDAAHPCRRFDLASVRWHGGRWTRIAYRPALGFYRKPIALEAVWRQARRCGCTLSYVRFEFEFIALAQKRRADAEASALARLTNNPSGGLSRCTRSETHGT